VMSEQGKRRRTLSTARLGVCVSLFFLITCAATPFPREKVYVADVTNQVCAEYEIIDYESIKVDLVKEYDLLPGGPCDRMVGFNYRGFKKVQNWVRDRIKADKR